MSEWENLRDSDPEYQNSKEELRKKKLARANIHSIQKKNAKKGKPTPVLAPHYQIQNTTKLRQKLEKQEKQIQKEIETKSQRALEKRKAELAKEYPEEFKKHQRQIRREKEIRESMEKIRENQRDRDRER